MTMPGPYIDTRADSSFDDCPAASSSRGYFPGPDVWGAQTPRTSVTDLVATASARSMARRPSVTSTTSVSASSQAATQYGATLHRSAALVNTRLNLKASPGFSPLPESPAILPSAERTEVLRPTSERCMTNLTGDPWPETVPLRLSEHRMQRKLPPSMTESLEALMEVSVKAHKTLSAVPEDGPEDGPPRPLRSPLRSVPMTSIALAPEVVARLPAPKHRRSASGPAKDEGCPPPSRPFGLPRSVSSPLVGTPTTPMRRKNSDSSESNASIEMLLTPPSSLCVLPQSVAMQRSGAVEYVVSPQEVKRERKAKVIKQAEDFEPNRPVDVGILLKAAEQNVMDQNGKAIRFGDLVSGTRRTVVVFVRHWLSSFCAQYIRALMTHFVPGKAGGHARVIVIGHGSVAMIPAYRNHFHCPFEVYTDPTRRLQDLLGLLPHSLGSTCRGDYVMSNAVVRACETLQLAARLHGFRSGDREQLGGEFVFNGRLELVYAHRMRGASDHASLADLVAATIIPISGPLSPSASRSCISLSLGALRSMPNVNHVSKTLREENEEEPEDEDEAYPQLDMQDVDEDGLPSPLSRPRPRVKVSAAERAHWDLQRQSLLARRPSRTRVPLDHDHITVHMTPVGTVPPKEDDYFGLDVPTTPSSPSTPTREHIKPCGELLR